MINKKILETEIRIYRKTKIWTHLLQNYFQAIVEAVVSNYGADLDREETIQECWLFLMKLIPKIKIKGNKGNKGGNIGSYTYTSLRHYVSDIREVKFKHTYVSLDAIDAIEVSDEDRKNRLNRLNRKKLNVKC
jgi:hypothetical protein